MALQKKRRDQKNTIISCALMHCRRRRRSTSLGFVVIGISWLLATHATHTAMMNHG